MRRYLGIFTLLLVLGWFYARVGGFGVAFTANADAPTSNAELEEDSLTSLTRVSPEDADAQTSLADQNVDATTANDSLFGSIPLWKGKVGRASLSAVDSPSTWPCAEPESLTRTSWDW